MSSAHQKFYVVAYPQALADLTPDERTQAQVDRMIAAICSTVSSADGQIIVISQQGRPIPNFLQDSLEEARRWNGADKVTQGFAAVGEAGRRVIDLLMEKEVPLSVPIGITGAWHDNKNYCGAVDTIRSYLQDRGCFNAVMLESAAIQPNPNAHVRYHVTAAANDIMRDGFKLTASGGIGGSASTSGETYTFAELWQAQKLLKLANAMETVRTSAEPLVAVETITGQTQQDLASCASLLGLSSLLMNERALALELASFHLGYIPASSFALVSPHRRFQILEVDISNAVRIGGEKDGHEMWEPSSLRAVRIIDAHADYVTDNCVVQSQANSMKKIRSRP